MNADKQISLIVPGTVNREDVADGAVPGVSPQKANPCPEARLRGPGADSMHIGKANA